MSADEAVRGPQGISSYREAGVNIDAGKALVETIKAVSQRTRRPEVLSQLGGFGALCELPSGYQQPVLVSATDGVGTKLKLAVAMQHHLGIGIDLVAMCVNDLIVCGAEPLFFLDYYATGALQLETATEVISGISSGCELAGCALIGGETAEMPGMYQGEDYDLAGFAVGVVEKSDIIDQSRVRVGDSLVGIDSSGPHANGYSLIRRILQHSGARLDQSFGDISLGETLLTPTLIYVKALQAVASRMDIHAVAHITGGGITENLPRVLPEQTAARIDTGSWQRPPIFHWLQQQGQLPDREMWRTFNCGIGMVLCLDPTHVPMALAVLQQQDLGARVIGEIVENPECGEPVVLG